MKIPYIKVYTADLLALSRNVTPEQLGEALLGICEQAFENSTLYQPQTARETALFEMLTQWKEESQSALEQHKKKMKKARSLRWTKKENSVGQSLKNTNAVTVAQHTETETNTETDTETEPETENINTPTPPTAQGEQEMGEKKSSNPQLRAFAAQVIERFEAHVQTPAQQRIWYHKNRRHLRDILEFCGQDITLALQTIEECILCLKKEGLTGGYAAVCRNLPEYYAQAKRKLEEAYGYTK